MKKQLLLILMTLLPMVASAYEFAIKNADGVTIYYNYINDQTELEVTYRNRDYNSYTGSVAIPGEVIYMNKTLKVTSIGDHAFHSCSGLTSITIPNSVTSIGGNAFRGCSSLTSLTIPNSVTSIGGSAFYECINLISATIPNNVTSIESNSFWGCISLTSVTIPNSVTRIGTAAFTGCSGLTSVTIPNSLKNIRDYVFCGCRSLTSVTIPNSIISIGNYAFEGCTNLSSVIIGESVSSIETESFCHCPELTDIYCFAEKVPQTISSAFAQTPIHSATLHVPAATINNYKAVFPWRNFGNIVPLSDQEMDVDEIMTENKEVVARYAIGGQQINKNAKGLNIIKMSDGTTKKVMGR